MGAHGKATQRLSRLTATMDGVMSVLIEAMSLVIPRTRLEERFPGGTEGFLAGLKQQASPCRYACADNYLVSVSFYVSDHADRTAVPLRNAGLIDIQDDHFRDFALTCP